LCRDYMTHVVKTGGDRIRQAVVFVLLRATDHNLGYQWHSRFLVKMDVANGHMEPKIRFPSTQLREDEFENKLTPLRVKLHFE
jgi:hypothetical protein